MSAASVVSGWDDHLDMRPGEHAVPGLFELKDFPETRVAWVPVSSMERCRDCGQRSGISQGGSRRGLGVFVVCDACAALDGCADDGSGRHVSFWGGHGHLAEVRVTFYMPAPTSVKRARPSVAPDLSKLVRAVEDALTAGGVWDDDSRVVDLEAHEFYADAEHPPGAEITVREVVNR